MVSGCTGHIETESSFTHKMKAQWDKSYWNKCGCPTSWTVLRWAVCYIGVVLDGKADNLIYNVEGILLPGNFTHEGRMYLNIARRGFLHNMAIHSHDFVDYTMRVHAQTIGLPVSPLGEVFDSPIMHSSSSVI